MAPLAHREALNSRKSTVPLLSSLESHEATIDVPTHFVFTPFSRSREQWEGGRPRAPPAGGRELAGGWACVGKSAGRSDLAPSPVLLRTAVRSPPILRLLASSSIEPGFPKRKAQISETVRVSALAPRMSGSDSERRLVA